LSARGGRIYSIVLQAGKQYMRRRQMKTAGRKKDRGRRL